MPERTDADSPQTWADRRIRGGDGPDPDSSAWPTRRSAAMVPSRRVLVAAGSVSGPESAPEFSIGSDIEDTGSGRTPRSRPEPRRLGAGLVEISPEAAVDPDAAILADPEVPESKRFCWSCRSAVGRGVDGQPGEVAGECRNCGSRFNFRPILAAGEVVAGQYEVRGCLAHGGLGWIYLAVDRNVSDRWVVLKGLQNPQDFEAHVVALAERQFLSEVAHPGIVKIYNFVKHRAAGREVADGYIVMEYVGGKSLRMLLDEAAPQPLPVAEAIAYVMEVLPALDYLHSLGLSYNDLKPDNIIVGADEVKLIDLGAVAALDSYGSIYGTPGYQAPEITETGPTLASDIYTVGRTLAVLAARTPESPERQAESPIGHPALDRLLRRATDPDPARRFPSTYAMHRQLTGVLRMVLAGVTGREYPQASVEFGSMRGDFGIDTLIGPTDGIVDGRHRTPTLRARAVARALPVALIDPTDPSADLLGTLLHTEPGRVLDSLLRMHERIDDGVLDQPISFGLESALVAVRAYLDLGRVSAAREVLEPMSPDHGTDWRLSWYSGIAALLEDEFECAFGYFDAVHTMVPGEIAPVLALAATAELTLRQARSAADTDRWHARAVRFYRTVWCTNHGVVSAAFGLARRLAAVGDTAGAVEVLDEVPVSSRHHAPAQMTIGLLLVSCPVDELTERNLAAAADRLAALGEDPRAPQLRIVVLGAALAWVRAGGQPGPNTTLLGFTCSEPGLRRGVESGLRTVARMAPDRPHRYRLIDLANGVRPRTRW
ncbi:MAG: protein kinase [Nocardia sp.]|nr:protein kinase [Nocardia sp.]